RLRDALVAHEAANPPAELLAGTAAPRTRTAPVSVGIDCQECGKPMVIRRGKRGPFLGCSGYPKCRHTEEAPPELLERAPQAVPAYSALLAARHGALRFF